MVLKFYLNIKEERKNKKDLLEEKSDELPELLLI